LQYVYQQPELEREIAEAATAETLEAALSKVLKLNQGFREPEIYGRQLFAGGFDRLVPEIAAKLNLEDMPGAKSNANPCIVATRFYGAGGHSQVAMDIQRRFPDRGVSIVLTNLYVDARYQDLLRQPRLRSTLNERAHVLLRSRTIVERILELYMILSAVRPSRIFLMGHHMDIVSVVGCWPFRDVVEFVHHADHMPSIGATVPFSSHVDLTWTCHQACRDAGLEPTYSGMTAPGAQAVRPAPAAGAPLRIATSGSPNKFAGRGRFTWHDYAIAALKRPETELVHIGHVEDGFEAATAAALQAAGVDPARYVFAGWARSLGEELVARKADVYLSSYPETGSKANLEAVVAHLPVIVPLDADAPPLIRYSLPLEHWLPVATPDEMPDALDRAVALAAWMREPAELARLDCELDRFDAYVAMRPLLDA
jgi:hypothetical protein